MADPVKVDYGFRRRLAEVIDGNRISNCYQCGACVGDCPAARYDPEFNPRRIMLKALYGLAEEIIGPDSEIWNCTNCCTCVDRCPQEVKPVEVIIALKNLMEKEGCAPQGASAVAASIRETGRSTIVTSATTRMRESFGLPPLNDPPREEIAAILEGRSLERAPDPEPDVRPGTRSYAFFPGCLIPVKYPQMEAAIRLTLPRLDLASHDLPGFSCCPDPIYFKASEKFTWLTLAARNLAVAEEAGLDIFTVCSGCTATLCEAVHHLRGDEGLRRRVNERLALVGREYKGEASARHLVTILRDEVGYEAVAASVERPLKGLTAAVHYGCHLLKPKEIMQVDEPDEPVIMDRLLEAIGVKPVRHRERLLCCGKACQGSEIPGDMMSDVLDSALETGADCLGMICPTCFDQFDTGQLLLARKRKREKKLPPVYYFQLLALAQGFSVEQVGLHRHKIKLEVPIPD